jgi:hypothetical protein
MRKNSELRCADRLLAVAGLGGEMISGDSPERQICRIDLPRQEASGYRRKDRLCRPVSCSLQRAQGMWMRRVMTRFELAPDLIDMIGGTYRFGLRLPVGPMFAAVCPRGLPAARPAAVVLRVEGASADSWLLPVLFPVFILVCRPLFGCGRHHSVRMWREDGSYGGYILGSNHDMERVRSGCKGTK